MARYLYVGPNSGVTLQDGTEVILWNGKEVELTENEYVKTLLALGHLKPVQETKKKKEVTENAS